MQFGHVNIVLRSCIKEFFLKNNVIDAFFLPYARFHLPGTLPSFSLFFISRLLYFAVTFPYLARNYEHLQQYLPNPPKPNQTHSANKYMGDIWPRDNFSLNV